MDLIQEKPGEHHYIHSFSNAGIRVVDQLCSEAFIISARRLILDWPVNSAEEITAIHLDPILELEPELVLIGTGARQVFLSPELLMPFYQQAIGVEIMSTQAACRTFNVLVSEGRKVVAALLPPTR
jgi:uncharacterized protein